MKTPCRSYLGSAAIVAEPDGVQTTHTMNDLCLVLPVDRWALSARRVGALDSLSMHDNDAAERAKAQLGELKSRMSMPKAA